MEKKSINSFGLIDIFISSASKYKFLFIISFTSVLLIKFGVLPLVISEFLLQIIAIITVVLGLPLSAALRVDQLSFNLGAEYSREFILFISLIVTYFNLTILLFLKRIVYPINKNGSDHKDLTINTKRNNSG